MSTISNFDMVGEFMKACDQEVKDIPTMPDISTRILRLNLILEEYKELEDADDEEDLVGIADALTDILYVVYGAGHAYGIDLDACFREVHRSNMTKVVDGKVVKNADGKVMKPPSYNQPNLQLVLDNQRKDTI